MTAIVLTDKCNLSCRTCFRPRESGHSKEPWLFHELEECLGEIAAAGHSSVFYTGGEPSLWKDGRVSFTQLLVASSRQGLFPMFVTNGRPFSSYDKACALLDRYFDSTSASLHVVVSVDYWHEGSWANGASPALETILHWQRKHESFRRLEVEVASLCCLDETRNIPPQEFARYADAGIRIGYLPLSPRGRSRELEQIAPTLCPTGTSKASLGPYGEALRRKMGISHEDWDELDNWKLLGPCFAIDTLTLGPDHHYWLCNSRAGESLHLASAGELTRDRMAECLERNPLVGLFRQNGFAETLHQCQEGTGPLPADIAQAALARQHPYCVGGRATCGLCKSLPHESFS